MPKVFISYRRSDTTPGYASWIYDRLAESIGEENVFMDIDSLPLGVDFVEQLENSLHQADLALILIGPNWLDAADESGVRRLDDPNDFVRLEVAAALRADARVIPVLVDGAVMPRTDVLPEELRFLARRQALIFNRHGGTAIRDLMKAVRQVDADRARAAPPAETAHPQAPAAAPEPVADAPPEPVADAPPKAPPTVAPRPRGRSSHRLALLLAVGGLAAAAIVVAVVLAGGGSGHAGGSSAGGGALSPGATSVGNSPDAIEIRDTNVWVANAGDGTVTQLAQSTGDRLGTDSFATQSQPAAPLSLWHRILWVGQGMNATIARIDPASGKPVGPPIAVHGVPCAISAVGGSLWVANLNGTVIRIVPEGTGTDSTYTVQSIVHVGSGPKRMAWWSHALWVANLNEGTITRIDGAGQVLSTVPVGGHPGALAVLDGSLWLADRDRNTVTRLDPSGRPTGASITVGRAPKRMAGENHTLWVADSGDGTVTRIDTTTDQVRTIRVGGYPGAVTATGGVVWVAVWSRPTIQDHGPAGWVVRIDENTGKVIGS